MVMQIHLSGARLVVADGGILTKCSHTVCLLHAFPVIPCLLLYATSVSLKNKLC
uniref:Uncharacterized protein n=1 Tax=Anguilla anguilla TaxID=7936 RepID=A0A0E9QUD1_ANGAN